MPNQPLYGPGDTVYLRESAALGFLDAIKIGSASLTRAGWVYTVQFAGSQPAPGSFYGDRNSLVNGALVYYSEGDFCLLCTAVVLAEDNAKRQYDKLKAQRIALCPNSDDVTGAE